MRNKTVKLTVLLLCVFLVLLSGTAIAYMLRRTQLEENQFTPASVDCTVHEAFNGTSKTSIRVENTGNIDSYIRLRMVSYWVDSEGNIAAKASEIPQPSVASGWLRGSGNTYYYQSPVAPGQLTGELLSSTVVLREEDGYRQVVEVFAEAIQSLPGSAVESSWNVQLDGDGKITIVP